MAITLRRAVPSDEDFFIVLYRSTREQEMEMGGLPEEEREKFVHFQYNARKLHYDQFYEGAVDQVVMSGKTPIGRLLVQTKEEEIIVVTVELLAEYRGKGIGSRLMKDVLAKATVPVSLHVLQYGGPIELYKRLGFIQTGTTQFHYKMQWYPEGMEPPASVPEAEQSETAQGDT